MHVEESLIVGNLPKIFAKVFDDLRQIIYTEFLIRIANGHFDQMARLISLNRMHADDLNARHDGALQYLSLRSGSGVGQSVEGP